MDTSFIVKLALTFLVGSLWVTCTTIVAEQFGSNIGGWMGGMPLVVVVSLFFIRLTQTTDAAVQATTIIPLMVCFNGLFLVTYAFLASYNFALGILGAIFVSILPAITVTAFNWADYGISMVICVCAFFLWYYLLRTMNIDPQGRVKVIYTRTQMLGRASLSGLVMVAAVIMSKLGGPILGGSLSAFPGSFLSTLIITHDSGGLSFSRAVTMPMMVSGMINVVVYITAVRYLYSFAGLGIGTLIAYTISAITGYFTYLLISRDST